MWEGMCEPRSWSDSDAGSSDLSAAFISLGGILAFFAMVYMIFSWTCPFSGCETWN